MADYLRDRGYPYNPHTARLLRNFQAQQVGNNKPEFHYQPLPPQTWLEMVADQRQAIINRYNRTDPGSRRTRLRARKRRVHRAMGLFGRMEHGGKN